MKFTISDFRNRFPTDDSCLDEIFQHRYGSLTVCPAENCRKAAKFYRVSTRRCYACQWCGYQLYPTKGTPFEKTSTPLSSWFYVIYLMTATRSGVSAKEVERQLGVTYKTAWRMCHQVRKLMAGKDVEPLKGHVEVDETYSGGKRKGKRGRGAEGKTPVFGMLQREGSLVARVVQDVRKKTLMPLMEQHVAKGTTVSSDELKSYNGVAAAGYVHGTVNHSQKQYVNGEHHTQSIEGFWSRLKLSIRGTHVHVSKQHLQKYVDEFSFRFNNRESPAQMFDQVLLNLEKPAV